MQVVSLAEFERHPQEWVRVAAREGEILIESDGAPIARLTSVARPEKHFPDLRDFRAEVPEGRSAVEVIREMRDEERF